MATQVPLTPDEPLVFHFGDTLRKLTDREFYEFCRLNPEMRIERTSDGDLIIMPPTGGETGRTDFELTSLFGAWVKKNGTGIGFDSSTVFALPNGAKRSPDLAWVRRAQWAALTKQQQEEFPPLCPDFVVELRSRTDRLDTLKAKMQEYIANGALLGWLIDPIEKKVYVCRPGAEAACLDRPETVSGAPVLPGFELGLQDLWG
jgi:Uma2 family endonuclease